MSLPAATDPGRIRVLLADDQNLVRNGYQSCQCTRPGNRVETLALALDKVLNREQFRRKALRKADHPFASKRQRQANLPFQHGLARHRQVRPRSVGVTPLNRRCLPNAVGHQVSWSPARARRSGSALVHAQQVGGQELSARGLDGQKMLYS